MRETCIPALVESWYQILQTYQRSHSELTCQCLEVVGAYVSWIDLNLIANDRLEHLQSQCDLRTHRSPRRINDFHFVMIIMTKYVIDVPHDLPGNMVLCFSPKLTE